MFWGRYLVRVPAVSEGLTKQEISFIHGRGIKILPVYNAFREAKGYRQGVDAARDAVYYAGILGIPGSSPLFANIENFFQVDGEWIQGWTEEMLASGYYSGIYNDPVTGGFNGAFCNAARKNQEILIHNILWSAQPETEPGGPGNQPDYKPSAPDCGGNVWVWQYSRKTTRCPIDFNLAVSGLAALLW